MAPPMTSLSRSISWSWALLLVLACACSLGACGAGGSNEVAVRVSQASAGQCPGGLLTPAGARELASVRGAPARCPYVSAAAIGQPGEGVFRQPEAIAVGPSGSVYVGDQFSHVVQVFSPTGAFLGQWGSAGAGRGGFGAVGGLATDAQGNVYLVDATHDRVEKYTASGRFVTAWGSRGSGVGQFDFGAGDGPDKPPGGGIAVSGSHVFVADTRNGRIERFGLDGTGAQVIAREGTAPGEVRRPQGLAAAPAEGASGEEALYVADNGNDRVQELTGNGRFVAQASEFPATPSTFQNPYDVAVHGDSVYVVDDNHGRIVRFNRSLGFLGAFSGSGPYRLTHFLRAVATSQGGNVYVADSSANRIDVYMQNGSPLRGWGRSGIEPGQFVAPVDVAAGPGARVLVAEAFREIVPLYPARARLSYRAEIAYGSPWSSGGGVTLGSRFFSPTGLAFAPDGTVWVSDRNNDVVRHLDANGDFITAVGTVAGAGRAGGSVALSEPHGLAVTPSGEVIVADTGANRVLALASDGLLLASWSGPPFREPLAVAAGAHGNVYVADTGNDRVEELDAAGRPVTSWGGAGSAPGRFENPDGIALDATGDVFVADGVLDRIQEFSPHGQLLAAWGSEGTALGALSEPVGMSVDCHGELLVAESGNNRVQIFTGVAAPSACAR